MEPGETMSDSESIFRALAKAVALALALWLLITFLQSIGLVILIFLLAIILFLGANPLVTMLEQKGVPRIVSALGLLLGGLIVLAGLVLLIAPQFGSQFAGLVEGVPGYIESLQQYLSGLLDDYPRAAEWLQQQADKSSSALTRLPSLLSRIGKYTLGAVTGVVFLIILVTTVIYMLSSPRPLINGYLGLFPEALRDPAADAFSRSMTMVMGWIRSNIIVGGIEGVAAGIFLSIMGIPGAIVWAVLTFFSELIPKLGPYLMTIPPVLIALTISPMTAVWVLLFYLVLQELTGDLIAPKVRGSEMKLHPVSIMFGVLAMTMAFGLLGAIIATPIVGIVKVCYEEFYLKRYVDQEAVEARTERMLRGEVKSEEKDEK